MEDKKESVDYYFEQLLPKCSLSPTANPNVFLDKETGELFYLYISPQDFGQDPKLVQLNKKRE